MSTVIKAELSKNNEYWIEKHRYYELKHFCLQYPIWKKAKLSLDGLKSKDLTLFSISKNNQISDPTAKCAEARAFYSERIALLDRIANETDPELSSYILEGVTKNLSYDKLKLKYDIPCCRDVYYKLYRKFFWLLNKARQ